MFVDEMGNEVDESGNKIVKEDESQEEKEEERQIETGNELEQVDEGEKEEDAGMENVCNGPVDAEVPASDESRPSTRASCRRVSICSEELNKSPESKSPEGVHTRSSPRTRSKSPPKEAAEKSPSQSKEMVVCASCIFHCHCELLC